MNAPMSIAQVRQGPSELASIPDQSIDMFTERGFVLANRIAKAYASSDAIPVAFRSHVLKKNRNGDEWIENPSAIGNCLVAIETARAVGMSITSVMQNANVIEGRLSWSAQFVIASINASGRFHPLRFDIKNRGPMTAKYREKQGWNKEKNGYDFKDVEVKIVDEVCVAWTLPKGMPFPPNVFTLDQAKAANLPVIESAPVSMKLAVEEGWYGKSGSKWQTEMKTLMLQYRAGAFFGRIHAPDIMMGMGRTSEELADVVDVMPNGTYTVTSESLRTDMQRVDQTTGEITHDPSPTVRQQAMPDTTEKVESKPAASASTTAVRQQAAAQAAQGKPAFDLDAFATRIEACRDIDTLDLLADEVSGLERDQVLDADAAQTLLDVYRRRREALANPQPTAAPAQAAAAAPLQGTSRRRAATPGTAPE